MPAHQNLDNPLPTGSAAAPPTVAGGAKPARQISYEKIAAWAGLCVVPWVIIAAIVWAFYG